MKKLFLPLTIILFAVAACDSTGKFNPSDPAVQAGISAAIADVIKIADAAAQALITGYLGGSHKSATLSDSRVQGAISATQAKAKAAHPEISAANVDAIVRGRFALKLQNATP
jgi:hypothetical protein